MKGSGKSSRSKKVDPPPPPTDPPQGEVPTIDPSKAALDFLIQGANRQEAIDALKKSFPGLDPDDALDQALDLASGTAHTPGEILFGLCHLKLIDLHQQLRATGDFAGAVGAVKAQITLGKYTVEKFQKKAHRAGKQQTGTDGAIQLFVDEL